MDDPGRLRDGATADGLAVAPSMSAALQSVRAPRSHPRVDGRVAAICAVSVGVAGAAALAAELLARLIGLITSLAFHGRWDTRFASPAGHHLGAWVIVVPVAGALVVGVMARYGSAAIRGHGIPEVMEKVLRAESRIPPRVMLLKPVSAAVAAVLLAVELLLFEYRARSIVPVSLAAVTAAGVRLALAGPGPVFRMPAPAQPGAGALAAYVALGAAVGLLAAWITRAIYAIEDAFERLPVHWMWWPAMGAVAVGVIGYVEPRTLGVGYTNIEQILSGGIAGGALAALVALKFVSWAVYLGSGTSGGTLAPLFTIGGGVGALAGAAAASALPGLGVDPHAAALVGMAAVFAGASHALLASVVFAFETTRQPMGLLPLLAGCSAAYLVSLLASRNSIMTEKLARRGTEAGTEYASDFLAQVRVGEVATRAVRTLRAEAPLAEARAWLADGAGQSTHHGFPVVDAAGALVGVVTRRDLADAEPAGGRRVADVVKREPVVAYEDNTLREAADHMVREGVGRLAVVSRERPRELVGIVTRSDLLGAHARRLKASHRPPSARRVRARSRPE